MFAFYQTEKSILVHADIRTTLDEIQWEVYLKTICAKTGVKDTSRLPEYNFETKPRSALAEIRIVEETSEAILTIICMDLEAGLTNLVSALNEDGVERQWRVSDKVFIADDANGGLLSFPQALDHNLFELHAVKPKVTPAYMVAKMIGVYFSTPLDGIMQYMKQLEPLGNLPQESAALHEASHQQLQLTTFCLIVMENGTVFTGESHDISKENYNAFLGRKYAYQNAFEKLWEPLGYELATNVQFNKYKYQALADDYRQIFKSKNQKGEQQ